MANSHGIGVKRNDYHRKNRKENKGWRWRFTKGGVSASMLDRLARMTIAIPRLTRFDLEAQAERDTNRRSGLDGVIHPNQLERICVNYIRHQLTNYDGLMNSARRQGARDAYLLISKKVFDAIGEAYPWLASECAAQYAERSNEVVPALTGTPRLIKRGTALTSEHIAEKNRYEDMAFAGISDEYEIPGFLGEVDIDEDAKDPRQSSLNPERFIYFAPFIKLPEVQQRRFAGAESSDRWWEWEEEAGYVVRNREHPRHRRA